MRYDIKLSSRSQSTGEEASLSYLSVLAGSTTHRGARGAARNSGIATVWAGLCGIDLQFFVLYSTLLARTFACSGSRHPASRLFRAQDTASW